MPKILILANNAGGLYNFRFELVSELIKQNFRVYFVVPQSAGDKKVQLIRSAGAKYIQVHVDRRGINPFKDIKLAVTYKRIIKDVNPDIVLTYTVKPNIYGTYAANMFKKPVIMNITGIGSSLISGKLRYIVKNMYKYACSKAEITFFQNQGNRDFFLKNNIIVSNRTKLIPGSGVNIDMFTPLPKTKNDRIVRFLYVGRIMREKGIEEYLQVADMLTKKYQRVEFQILGSFEEEKYNGIVLDNDAVKYLGSSHDVRKEIREVDCIVHPSYHEGMSNALLEAAAMGKPLIASDIPGCKEIIDDESNGYLFRLKSVSSLEEKLVKFIRLNENMRLTMGKNSREKVVKEFDRNIVVKEYMEAIEGILKEGLTK